MCNRERLLDEREKDQVFNIYINQCNEHPHKDIFALLIEAQDNKTVNIRDQEWGKWSEDIALDVKAKTLKEVGAWLQTKCGNISKLNRNKCRRITYVVRINNRELEALKQGAMLKDE